ncbi:hypothetical protein V6N11_042223 [Hibiscus sabdariffa]|uniref:Disease resistance protein At4g27190-like leucine-rich repeats domain-containing protein n=1 Tax=Hibiscus sabdariffa TaxID=183260 RepID=A0ABR2QVR9_9ROSI
MIKSRFPLLNDSHEPCKAISFWDIEGKNFPEKLECPKLEFLLLKNIYIKESKGLAAELRKLENLKILDLADSRYSYNIPSDVIRRLSKLEELYLSIEEESTAILPEINLLTSLTTLSIAVSSLHLPKDFRFPELKRYSICITRSGIKRGGKRLQAERSLFVEMFDLNLVSQLLDNIEFLGVSNLEDELLSDQRQKVLVPKILQNLKELRIEHCGNLNVAFQNVEENVEPLLSNLKLLYLQNLPKLSHIWELPIQHVRLEALVKFEISSCPSLKSIFSISLARSLTLLEYLEIRYCGELKQIVTESEGGEEEISLSINSPNTLCFPRLREVHIKECDGLEYIFPTLMAPQGLPQLENIHVHHCRQLKQLVRRTGGTENDVQLQQLQFLKPLTKFSVSGCPLLSDSFVRLKVEEAHFKDVRLSAFKGSLSIQKHLQLTRAIEGHNVIPEANKDGLNGLTSLEVMQCKDFECLVDTTAVDGSTSAFTHLERLSIKDSFGLETLCKGQTPHGFLKNIKELVVEYCYKLRVIFQMDDLPYSGEQNQEKQLSNLQSLKLKYLEELRWILKGSAYSFSLQSLKVVNIEYCNKLEYLFSPSLIQSLVMLEELSITNCYELKTLITELENNDGETESNSSLPTPTLFSRKLKSLYISGCRKLQYALPIHSAKALPALVRVVVSNCDELRQVFSTVKEQNGVEQDGIIHLGNLRHVQLHCLWNLSYFAPENYIFKAPALKTIEVDECPCLMNFVISHVGNQLRFSPARLSSWSDKPEDLPLDRWEALESLVHATQKVNGLCAEFIENNKKLIVKDFKQLQEIFRNGEENQAPSLLSIVEHLRLEDLRELRWIVKVPTHSVSFQSLLVLEITGCKQLKSLFSLSAIQSIRSLQQLKIFSCNELKSVFMELESSDDDNVESSTLYLPNLKSVDISCCHNTEYVFPLALAGGLPCLQKISLINLENLSTFFAENNIVEAPALEILHVKACPRLTSFIIQREPNKSVSLKVLDLQPMSCNRASVPLVHVPPSFEYLTMEQPFQLQGEYSNLEDLKISNMIWLRDICKGPIQSARNLRKLSIASCHGLTYIFPMRLVQNLPQLNYLGIA